MSPRIMAAFLIAASGIAPEMPTVDYIDAVIEICADIYGVDGETLGCIIEWESQWNPSAVGDNGKAIGLFQWHEESIKVALRDMGICWDWTENGDPRLNVWASTLAAVHALSKGWPWWSTRALCEGP